MTIPNTHTLYAALSFDLTVTDLGADKAVRLLPMWQFVPNDGRPLPSTQWNLSDGCAARIVDYWRHSPERMVIDYEHQTQKADANGQPAPAAGWVTQLEARADGLYATIEWTAKAIDFIKNGEYRYISPVFSYDSKTGEVLHLYMAALVNTPGLSGLTELNAAMLKACHAPRFSTDGENDVKDVNKKLGLADDAKPEDTLAAIATLQADLLKTQTDLSTVMADKETAVAQVATLKAATAADAGAATIATLQSELVTLRSQVNAGEVDKLVNEALIDGRLIPSTQKWATELGNKDVAQLKSFLAVQPKIAALQGQQTHGTQHAGGADASGLSVEELAVCSSMGMSPKDFATAKAAHI